MPRRYYEYSARVSGLERHVDGRGIDPGGRLRACRWLISCFRCARPPDAGPNPWRATGLEWQTDSPPPVHNFDELPVVTRASLRLLSRRNRGFRCIRPPRITLITATPPADDEPILSQQFDDVEQQSEASTLGMWLFLATEVMFFGGLLTAYAVYRTTAPEEFALASKELNVVLGLHQYGRPPGQQPDDGPGRSGLAVADATRAGPVAGAHHGPRNGVPRDQGDRMDRRLPRAPDPRIELPGPRERPVAGRARTTGSGKDGAVFRSLLLHDGPARHPLDHRHRSWSA